MLFLKDKVRAGETPTPAREMRAFPGKSVPALFFLSIGGNRGNS